MLPRPLDARKHYLKTARIAAITVVWSFIIIVAAYANFGEKFAIVPMIKDTLILREGYNNIFWFMQALIAIMLAYPIFKACYAPENKAALWSLMTLLVVYTFVDQGLNMLANVAAATIKGTMAVSGLLPWDRDLLYATNTSLFNKLAWPVVYFMAGGIIARHDFKVRSKLSVVVAIALFISAAIGLTAFGLIASKYTPIPFDTVFHGYNTLWLGNDDYRFRGALELIWWDGGKATAILGGATLGIYLIHIPVKWMLQAALPIELFNPYFYWVMMTVLCLSLSLAATLMLKRVPLLSALVKL